MLHFYSCDFRLKNHRLKQSWNWESLLTECLESARSPLKCSGVDQLLFAHQTLHELQSLFLLTEKNVIFFRNLRGLRSQNTGRNLLLEWLEWSRKKCRNLFNLLWNFILKFIFSCLLTTWKFLLYLLGEYIILKSKLFLKVEGF